MISRAIFSSATALILLVCACAPVSQTKEPEAASREQAVKAAAPGELTVAEIQRRRELERELERDHAKFLKAISERNVEEALKYVDPEIRQRMQTEFWRFLGDYSFSIFEVQSRKVNFDAKPEDAEIVAVLIVFQKNVVAPQRKEHLTRWGRYGDKWLIKP